MTKTTIRVEWGWWSYYADLIYANRQYGWDGSLQVKAGEILSLEKFNYWGLYGPSRETRSPLADRDWKSSIKPGENKGLEGIVFSLQGDDHTQVTLDFKKIRKIHFSLKDLRKEKKFKIHVGPKYSCADIIVSLDGYDEYVVNRKELSDASARDGRIRVLLESGDFKSAASYNDFSRVSAAWIAPQQEVTVTFKLKKKPKDPCRILVKALVVDPKLGDKIDWTTWEGGVRQRLKYRIFLNRKPIGWENHFFSSFRACQKLEELNFQAAPDLLQLGPNTVSIRNEDPRIYLLVNRLFVLEEPAVGRRKKERWPEHPAVMSGVDLNVASPENGEIDVLLRYLRDEKIANYVLFRTEQHPVMPDDWERWFRFCRQARIYFAIDPEGDVFPYKGVIFNLKKVAETARRIAGRYFVGFHFHEQSNLIYGWGIKEPLSKRRNRTILQARDAYLRHIRKVFRDCPPGVNRILGEGITVQHLDYQAGVDICQAETMTSHTVLLLAEARGAARAHRIKTWGSHVACHVHHFPEGQENERMFWLNLYLAYLYGARIIYDEESALIMFHGRRYSFSDKLPLQRRIMLSNFHQWCEANPLAGKPLVDIGILQGNGGVFTAGVNVGSQPVKVWGGLGPETKGWEYRAPENGLRYLDIFLPGVKLMPIKQDPARVRDWFSGTPYGQIDLTPIGSDLEILKDYRLLMLLGWNTMDEGIYQTLKEYVISGGTLFLSRRHLTTRADRALLLGRGREELLRDGDFSDFFGVKIGKKTEYTTARPLAWNGEKDSSLMENRLGRGKAYLLNTTEYPGNESLFPFVSGFLSRLAKRAQEEPLVYDASREVNYFVFAEGNRRRLYLVNTDWTTPGNVKKVRVKWAGRTVRVEVKEGQVASLLLK